jgi:hypothetical protein
MKPLKFDVPEHYTLTVFDEDFFEENKTDPAFYTLGHGLNRIAEIRHTSGVGANLYCAGDMRVVVDDDICRSVHDLHEKGIETDEDLNKIPEVNWHNNSWYESAFFYEEGKEDWNYYCDPMFSPEDAIHTAVALVESFLEDEK